jgi:DNA (cytosine-5)-methyltransferase 1
VTAYYNDHDKKTCAWLRELIKAGLIPAGEVDERSILDVAPADLAGFTSCHFFAGIGGWAYALRLAGWPDERPVWTGSPPCQPFSAAGKGLARDDPRHLAPHFVRLVRACRPDMLFGEQVASAAVFGPTAKGNRPGFEGQPPWAWLDDLSDRLEAARYAVGAIDLPAAGFGAPHIRQRTFFGAIQLADADDAGHSRPGPWGGGDDDRMADADRDVSGWRPGEASGAEAQGRHVAEPGDYRPVNDGPYDRPDPLDGFWRDADWLYCRDGKWRPVEPGLEPLAHGLPARVGRLRGYGNAIVPQAAATFIRAFCAAAGVSP